MLQGDDSMTRLKTEDICHIDAKLGEYNDELVKKTGHTLSEIAAHAVDVEEKNVNRKLHKVAIIPMSCGQGIIEGFSESVASIVNFLGFKTFVTIHHDASGIAEAIEKSANILMIADDDRFIAVNLRTGRISDNSKATGKGYAAALEFMCQGLKQKRVLIVGAGQVGAGATEALIHMGAQVDVYDLNLEKAKKLKERIEEEKNYSVKLETDLDSALVKHSLIIDACPALGYIQKRHITDDIMIVAPGIPLGINQNILPQVYNRLIHDPLQIGVATMVFDASII